LEFGLSVLLALHDLGITGVAGEEVPRLRVATANIAVRTSVHGVVLKSFWLKVIITWMAMAMEKHVNHSANPNRACGVLDDQDAAAAGLPCD
jgi:hypothetical protein